MGKDYEVDIPPLKIDSYTKELYNWIEAKAFEYLREHGLPQVVDYFYFLPPKCFWE